MDRILCFDIVSPWHAGSGRGSGPDLDATVVRSPVGLPYLPGRTIKGLLREACVLAAIPESKRFGWFGSPLVDGGGPAPDADEAQRTLLRRRFKTQSGSLRFSSGTVGASPAESAEWAAWAEQNREHLGHLFVRFSSTAIGATGVAKRRSLRAMECAVPMTICSGIKGPDDGWPDAISKALPFLRGLGAHRNRGFGRVAVRWA